MTRRGAGPPHAASVPALFWPTPTTPGGNAPRAAFGGRAPPAAPPAATTIERVISPGGIEAWLVRQPSVPLVAMDFAMIGGANEDPADKAGVAHLVASTIDEGAGDLDANAYHQRLEDHAIELSFSANRDHFRGSLRTLSANRDLAFDTLRLSLTAPRFDDAAVERIRTQILADLRRATASPGE